MPTITVKDGTQISTRTGDRDSRLSSVMAGHSARTTGTGRCCTSAREGIALSRTTDEAMAVQPKPGMGTTWTLTPTISPPSLPSLT